MSFYGWTEDKVRHMDGAQGWAYYHWARANQATVCGTGDRLKFGGYLRQEIESVMARMKKAKENARR